MFALAVTFGAFWNLRQKKIRPQHYLVRAELEARAALLMECRSYTNEAMLIDTFIDIL